MSKTWHDKNKDFNELLRRIFHSEDWHDRAEAARQLGIMKDARAVNLLCRALRSEENLMVQNRIMEALGKIGDGRATLRIIEKLKEELNQDNIDKFRITYIIESLANIGDRRALVYLGALLNSNDHELKHLAEKAFDKIEPNWRDIIEKKMKEKSFEDIFNIKL